MITPFCISPVSSNNLQSALHFLSKRCSSLSRELLKVSRAEIPYSFIKSNTFFASSSPNPARPPPQILNAEAEKQAAILHAEAVKEAKIREAEGEAEAILAVQKANAKAIELINDAAPSDAVIAIKSLEAFSKAADGKATKIIIPSEIQSLAGLAASLKELVTEPVAEEKNDSLEDKTE